MNLLGFDATPRAQRTGIGSHHSAKSFTDEWLTPPGIISALGPFDLDPSASSKRPWPTAERHFTKEQNGMQQEWMGRVWLNPPYGRQTARWMERLALHGNGIALIFARTETECWRDFIWAKATAVLFVYGRINFHHVTGERAGKNSGAPSALIAYGADNAAAILACSKSKIPGYFVPLKPYSKIYTAPQSELNLCTSSEASSPDDRNGPSHCATASNTPNPDRNRQSHRPHPNHADTIGEQTPTAKSAGIDSSTSTRLSATTKRKAKSGSSASAQGAALNGASNP